MNLRFLLTIMIAIALMSACSGNKPPAVSNTPTKTGTPAANKGPGPLPDKGFKAQITLPNVPEKLRVGQKETVTIHGKNASDVMWWMRGGEPNNASDNKFYMAAGNRWLDKNGKRLKDEGHNGIPKDLKPGEETDMTLQITAPQEPGEYTLEVDMLQEQVAWFSEKGSKTAQVKVTVVK